MRDAGHRTPDIGHRTTDIGHRTAKKAKIIYPPPRGVDIIIGITSKGKEFKLTQFADDTTLLLDGSERSLQSALNTLEIFGTFSGLKINKEKTKNC